MKHIVFLFTICVLAKNVSAFVDGQSVTISNGGNYLNLCSSDCLGCSQTNPACFDSSSQSSYTANYHSTYSSWSFKASNGNYLRRVKWCCGSSDWMAAPTLSPLWGAG
jgi:hypothetical protein